MSRVSEALIRARTAAGLTRQQLAGVWARPEGSLSDVRAVRSRASMIERWERGEREPSPANAAHYAFLCVSHTHPEGPAVQGNAKASAAYAALLVMLSDADKVIMDLYGRTALAMALEMIRTDLLYGPDVELRPQTVWWPVEEEKSK